MLVMNEPQLLARCREGETSAIELLVATHRQTVFRLALSILDDPAEADEAAQDVFVAVLRALPSFRQEAGLKTWLYRITVNICLGRQRKRRARQRLWALLASLFRAGSLSPAHPEEDALNRVQGSALWLAVQRLPEGERLVVVLRYYHEMTIAETAAAASVSERTVHNRLQTAQERMRVFLTERGWKP